MSALPDDEPRLGQPRVRDARADDGEPIATMLAELGWFDIDQQTMVRRAVHLVPDAGDLTRSLLVAELAGEVAGYLHATWTHPLFLAGPEAYVTELFVREPMRGRGVGTALLGALHRRAGDLGAARVRLIGNQDREHYRRGFYPSRGYEPRERLRVFDLPLGDGG